MDEPMQPWPSDRRSHDPASVGVVVVSWNTRELLARLLWGVRRVVAPGTVREIVVVDNGSDDGSLELASELAAAGAVRLVANDRQRYHGPGLTQGVNVLSALAAEGAAVDLVWVLDSDVLLLRPDVLTDAVAALRSTGAALLAERADYRPGPVAPTAGPLALCSLLLDPVTVWRPPHRPFLEDGEPSRQLQADLRAAGHTLAAFPFCTGRYLLHLGRGTLAEVRRRGERDNRYHSWAQTHHDPHHSLLADAGTLRDRFETRYRAAVGDGSTARLVEQLQT